MSTTISKPTSVDAHFPLAGIDRSDAFYRQKARKLADDIYGRTTYLAENVAGFEPGTLRARGGSRCGLSKFMSTRPLEWCTQTLDTVGTATGGGNMQGSNSGRVVTLVTVVQGDVYYANIGDDTWTAATNNTGDHPPLQSSGIIFSSQNGTNLFFADGVNQVRYDSVTQSVNRWVADDPINGPLPTDSDNNKPRLIETWRGRLVQAACLLDPYNIHFSRINQPGDYIYFPPTDAQGSDQAISLATAPQGLMGDLTTSICPYSDDLLLLFGDSSIYALSGDPMAGGQLDLVTKAVGGTFGRCWAMDPFGTVYFMSNKLGVYAFIPGQKPQRISQPIEKLLRNINTGDYNVCMGWDDEFQALRIFITPLDGPGDSTHFTFEQRTGAWFTTRFANTDHSPMVCCTVDGNRPDDRRLVLGSWKGYVYSFDPAAEDDDGTPIASSVLIGPFLTGALDEMLLRSMQAVLGEDSGDVTYSVLVGSTAEKALASTPVQTGTWKGGRNLTNLIRRAGHAAFVKISSSNRWAIEQIRLELETKGPVRQRGR